MQIKDKGYFFLAIFNGVCAIVNLSFIDSVVNVVIGAMNLYCCVYAFRASRT